MRSLLFCIFMFTLAPLRAQDTAFIRHADDRFYDSLVYTTDTVIFESSMRRNILTGTTKLTATHNQLGAMEYGLWFEKVTRSDCEHNSGAHEGQDRITSVQETDTSYIISMTIYDNCCYDFLCDISTDTTATLHLIYTGYGVNCACTCCFGLTYHLSRMKEPDTPSLKAVMINDDRSTRRLLKR